MTTLPEAAGMVFHLSNSAGQGGWAAVMVLPVGHELRTKRFRFVVTIHAGFSSILFVAPSTSGPRLVEIVAKKSSQTFVLWPGTRNSGY